MKSDEPNGVYNNGMKVMGVINYFGFNYTE